MTLSDSRQDRRLKTTLRPLPSSPTGLPRLPASPFRRAVPTTPADRAGARVDCFPAHAAFPKWPEGRRVGIRIDTFEACSGFTRVTARRIAQPPKATFVTRLQPCRLPDKAARQLPDLSTTVWVEPSSTGDSRLRGARPTAVIVDARRSATQYICCAGRLAGVWRRCSSRRGRYRRHAKLSCSPAGSCVAKPDHNRFTNTTPGECSIFLRRFRRSSVKGLRPRSSCLARVRRGSCAKPLRYCSKGKLDELCWSSTRTWTAA